MKLSTINSVSLVLSNSSTTIQHLHCWSLQWKNRPSPKALRAHLEPNLKTLSCLTLWDTEMLLCFDNSNLNSWACLCRQTESTTQKYKKYWILQFLSCSKLLLAIRVIWFWFKWEAKSRITGYGYYIFYLKRECLLLLITCSRFWIVSITFPRALNARTHP